MICNLLSLVRGLEARIESNQGVVGTREMSLIGINRELELWRTTRSPSREKFMASVEEQFGEAVASKELGGPGASRNSQCASLHRKKELGGIHALESDFVVRGWGGNPGRSTSVRSHFGDQPQRRSRSTKSHGAQPPGRTSSSKLRSD